MTIEILGLLGGALFAISGVPTAYQSIKNKRTDFIPVLTQWSVFCGAILTILYLYLRNGFDWVITLDYAITIISWGIILYFNYNKED